VSMKRMGEMAGLLSPQQAQSMVHVDRESGKGPDPYRAKDFHLNVRHLPEEFIWEYQLHSRYSDLKPSWQGRVGAICRLSAMPR
jgi:hypothetical protein